MRLDVLLQGLARMSASDHEDPTVGGDPGVMNHGQGRMPGQQHEGARAFKQGAARGRTLRRRLHDHGPANGSLDRVIGADLAIDAPLHKSAHAGHVRSAQLPYPLPRSSARVDDRLDRALARI